MELPNVPGESGGFAGIESSLSATREVRIGECHARRFAARDVIAAASRLILADPSALLLPGTDPASRYEAAYRQRLAFIEDGVSGPE
jgi:hypothetical protein